MWVQGTSRLNWFNKLEKFRMSCFLGQIVALIISTSTLREETSVLKWLNTLIGSLGCNDLIRYLEMFLHFNKHSPKTLYCNWTEHPQPESST